MRTDGFNHIAVMTQDLDRFCDFYTELLGAKVEHEEDDGPVRMRVVRIGEHECLNAFEVAFSREAWNDEPIFLRGRIDHLALNVPDDETFDALRLEVAARGLGDGKVNDFGRMRSFAFRDPDGMWLEICVPVRDPNAAWRTPEEIRESAAALTGAPASGR